MARCALSRCGRGHVGGSRNFSRTMWIGVPTAPEDRPTRTIRFSMVSDRKVRLLGELHRSDAVRKASHQLQGHVHHHDPVLLKPSGTSRLLLDGTTLRDTRPRTGRRCTKCFLFIGRVSDDAQASVWAGFTPELFKRHAEQVLRQCKDFARHPIVFVNAWNEWNEQAVMEPCTRWGTAVLDALESAIKNYMIPAKVSEVHKSLSVLPPETLTNVSVLLITSEEIPLRPESDEQISELIPHIEWYNMHDKQTTFHHIHVTPTNPLDRQHLFHLMRTRKPHLILTVGTFTNEMRILNTLPFAFRRLWVNWPNWEQVHPIAVMGAVHNCMFNHHLDHSHPLISVVTTAYKSGDRILRPFLSLLRQSYDNWEFVIVLDDDDDATWSILQHIQDRDFRVRVYRPSIRAGRIGEAKRDAFMLARGKILVEVDHDDELSDDCLKWLKDAYT